MATEPGYRIVDRLHIDQVAEVRRLIDGLRASPATIEPKYFYDELGCTLYAAICQLDEYYPTRSERAIFHQYRQEIAAAIGQGGTFVDLGAGDCGKARAWLPLIAPERYLAVDIAAPALAAALAAMATDFPEIALLGLLTDFSRTLEIPAELLTNRVTVFYPGSSIGNFTPAEATRFLAEICHYTRGGGLLIGVDAKKDKARLDAAYADALGVTAAFNRNALRHINRLIGSNFSETHWRHVGAYDETHGRIEMHLEALTPQTVMIGGVPRVFTAGERIHSENSYKYARDEFASMLRAAGFTDIIAWTDDDRAFWVFHAR